MTVFELMSKLGAAGIKLWLEEEQLKFKAPKGALTKDLKDELVAKKSEVIEFLKATRVGGDTTEDVIPPADRRKPQLLSFSQRRMWFIDQLMPANATFHIPSALFLTGLLDYEALRAAFEQLIARHESLRTTFKTKGEEPIQVIHEPGTFHLPCVDLTDLDDNDREAKAREIAEKEIEQGFDLTSGPLIRAKLLKLDDNRHALIVVMHHIISDGWSMEVFVKEISALYAAARMGEPSPLEPLPIQYTDFAQWQRSWLTDELLDTQLGYWKKQLANAPEELVLPFDRPRPAVKTNNGSNLQVDISGSMLERLRQLARELDVTLYVLLLAAYKIVLAKWSGQQDLCVGMPVAGRNQGQVENLIGFFVNTLVIRSHQENNPSIKEFVAQVREQVLSAQAHQDVPLETIVEALNVPRNLAFSPLYQVAFSYSSGKELKDKQVVAGLEIEAMPVDLVVARQDITMMLLDKGDSLAGVVEYNTDLFDGNTIETFYRHFCNVLETFTANTDIPVNCVELEKREALKNLLKLPEDIEAVMPLTPLQRDFVLDSVHNPDTVRDTIGYVTELPFEVDQNRWLAALRLVAKHRPNQRLVFIESMLPWLEPVYQGIKKNLEPDFEYIDLAENSEVNINDEESIANWVRKLVLIPFNVLGGQLIKHWLVKVSDNRYLAVASCHHAITDGSSEFIRAKDVISAYFDQASQPQSIESYQQFVDERRVISDTSAMLDFWHEQLKHVEPLGVKARDPGNLVVNEIELAGDKQSRLETWCQSHGVSFANLLRSVYALAVRRCYYQADDIALIEAVSGRTEADQDKTGCYFEFTPVLFKGEDCDGDITIASLLKQHRSWRKQLNDNIHLSFSARSKVISRDGLEFQFNYRLPEVYKGFELAGYHCNVMAIQPDNPGTVKLLVSPGEQSLNIRLSYYTNDFEGFALIQRIHNVLDQIAEGAETLNQLEWLLPEEKQKQLEQWQGDYKELPAPTVLDQIQVTVNKTPEAVAVKYAQQAINYSQLDKLSNQLANWLIAQGLQKGQRVAIAIDRSLELPVFILGVLKAGGVYVPIDPSYPGERIAYIVNDSNARLVLAEQCVVERLAQDEQLTLSAQMVLRSQASEEASQQPDTAPQVQLNADDSIYVIYTSGSTGRPKGAEVYHRGEVNLVNWYNQALSTTANDSFLLMSAIGFDLTQKNFFAPLVAGATLVLPKEGEYDPQVIADCIVEHKITVINSAPSVFYPIAGLTQHAGFPFKSLRHLVLGGEPIRSDSLASWLEQTQCVITNSYGPTECTDVVSAWQTDNLKPQDVLPIGCPIPNAKLYVVDRKGRLMPQGAIGELCVGGLSVGGGYLNNPDLNQQVFTANPYHDGSWYHTGDLVRYCNDGAIVYVGRKDFQVKLRGLRIEPGEIDAIVKTEKGIEDSLTLVKNDLLVTYIVASKSVNLGAIKQKLQQQLPAFMVPSVIMELPAWPLTPNGKIDRKALPEPSIEQNDESYVAPRNDSEQKIADIWCQVLKLDKVGVTTDFFSVGGHSLLATQVVSRIRQQFGVDLSVRALFEGPTIEQLVQKISRASDAGAIDDAPPITRCKDKNEHVLSFAQHRLWFIDQLNQGSAEYNMPAAMRIEGKLDTQLLDKALTEIVKRHEVLRTNFGAEDGEPTLIVREVEHWKTNIIDISDAPDTDAAINQQVDLDANKVFDLEKDLLLSTTLLKISDEDHVLLINMHHIVSDGWSISIFIQELTTLYQAFLNGKPSPLPELEVQYSDYAVWQRNWLQGETLERLKAYWTEALNDAPEVLRLPTDFPRPKQQTFNGAHLKVELGQERTQSLYAFCEKHDVTPFMVLMGTYQILLGRYCSQDDVCVGIPIAGRNRAEIENLIGFFINGLVIRTKLDGNPTVLDYLERVKEAALGAYAHQDMPADVLADTLRLNRSAEHAPGAQVGFALQNTPQENLGSEFAGLKLTPVYREHKTAKYEFSLILQELQDNVHGVVEYNTDLFKEETVARMMTHYNRILDQFLASDSETYIDNIEVLDQKELYQALNVNPDEFELFPLSPMQRDQYLDALVEPDSLKNSMGYHLITDGEFDFEIWKQAAQKLIQDQPLLRCYILGSDLPYTDVAYHCIRKEKQIEMDYIDLSDQTLTNEQAQQIAKDWVWRPYDVTKDELTEYRVYKLNGGRHMMCFRMNHLVADGVAMALHAHVNCVVADALKAGQEPPVIPPIFFNHIKENRVRMDKPETIAYWKDVSKNVEALDFSIPPQHEEAKEEKRIEKRLRVNDEHWKKIQAYCAELGIHPSLYFKAIYGMLINVYCRGESDFYFTEVLAGRTGMHKMTFGNYFQLLPVIFPQDMFETSSSVEDLFSYIKNYKRNLRKLADISLLQQRRILPQGRLNFMFNYYNFIPSLNLHGKPIISEACPQIQDGPIQFVVHEERDWIELVFIYLSNMFADLRFVERIDYISEQIVSGKRKIDELEYVLPDEKQRQLNDWNNTNKLPAPTSTVVDQFVSQASKTPDAIAVQMGSEKLTYQQLDQRSNQLSNLLAKQGVTKGDRVGVCLDRSVDMLVSVLGVLKAGGAYVPMDSNYPSERLAYMLEDSQAPVLLTQGCVVERLAADQVNVNEAKIICLDQVDLSHESNAQPENLPEPEDLIYIIYTSGSTGQPKGAAVKHQGESNLLAWYTQALDLGPDDKCLLMSAFGFDLTQKNLFAPLTKGAAIVIPEMEQYDVEAIADAIHQQQITIVNCAPSAFYPVAESTEHAGYPFSSLRYLVLGGEPIRVSGLKDWLDHAHCQCQLINSYGPTECTDVVSSYQMISTDEKVLPIGKPIQNTQLYVVDKLNKLVPEGVVGELCIAGRGVGAGYLNNQDLTAKAFGENPYSQDESNKQWYRSGDLVRYWPDGNLEYMGRKDFQVKLRGLRIELGEIEAALRKQPGVQDSLTIVVDDRLISYVIANDIDETSMRNKLRAHLPDYMLPAVIMPLTEWPLTPNGKVDRKALPSPDNKPTVEYVAPRNDIEERLANIWSEVLGIEKIGVFDNFFDLGGHSLLAARAVSKFRNEFDVEIPLRSLFELHTVADIAEYLQTLVWASESAEKAKEEPAEGENSGRIEGFL